MPAEVVKVVIKSEVSSKMFRVYIDGVRVIFKNGLAWLGVPSREGEHVLMWFLRDRPGMTYRLDLTEPAKVKMSYKSTLDISGMDAGIYWFKV